MKSAERCQSLTILSAMRLSSLGVISLLIIGAVSTDITKDEGTEHTISIRTLDDPVTKCHLNTPQDKAINFAPGDETLSTEKFEIQKGTSSIRCSVTIKHLDENDEGEWVISFTNDEGTGRVEAFNIIVKPLTQPSDPEPDVEESTLTPETTSNISKESEEEDEANEIEEETENAKVLTLIEQVVKEGYYVDISLNKQSFEEKCYIRKPKGQLVSTLSELTNVKTHKPSKFVSCRVTVGPITEDLLGEWNLCGRSVEDEKLRCQPVEIAWNNNDPTSNWHSRIEPIFNHPVHVGSLVNPGVMGSANVLTCHVITPAGEDLVLTSDVTYPNIERITNDRWLCSVAISDIDKSMLGDWAIYARFRSQWVALSEIRLPFNLFLYNRDDPYEQAYNVTSLLETNRVVNIGNTVTERATSSGQIDDCVFMSPAGDRFNLDNATKSADVARLQTTTNPTGCQISVGPVTKTMLGEWHIIGKFSNNNRFTEVRQPFNIVQEDPANPLIEDRERRIEYLPKQNIETKIGASHDFSINTQLSANHESCHLKTPQGLQYILMEGFNVPNVEILTDSRIECGVQINVPTEDMLGEWTLFSRSMRLSDPIERRLTFTLRIEETFSLGNPVIIQEGYELFLRLPEKTDLYETCKLIGPDGEQVEGATVAPYDMERCGFIVKNVTKSLNGTVTIEYGKGITYKGKVEVNVIDTPRPVKFDDEDWFLGSAVDKIVGPSNIVYCNIMKNYNENFVTVHDGFGPCRIKLDRVRLEDRGYWRMQYTVLGSVMTQVDLLNVNVIEVDPIRVSTDVEISSPSVTLTCSVPASYNVTGCKFRDPMKGIMVASQNVGHEGHIFYDAIVDHESSTSSHACSLRFSNPNNQYMGMWRCAVNTDVGMFYGFLEVRVPWIQEDEYFHYPEVEVSADNMYVRGLVGDPITMFCSATVAIRYCYFRSENGTIYSAGPDMKTENYKYVGNGLDAGECGIEISNLQSADTGRWTCNVGLTGDYHDIEKSTVITVEMNDKLTVNHFWNNGEVYVQPRIYGNRPIDYCRFVRIDGLGFTSMAPPEGYYVDRYSTFFPCDLVITRPTLADRRPWVVAVKLRGENGEIVTRTPFNLLVIPGNMPFSFGFFAWVMVMMFCLIVMAVGVAMIPKKNREWTARRASRIRDSFRRPRRETPPPAYTEQIVKTPSTEEPTVTREAPVNTPLV
ncbi:unnamed protein product [Chrysodeixis includens]|uniref:Immunoglobulin domain-containing protein n=1 Tax=Chrysodeixis includens TaxID=689277 RepID=A0A9N8Q1Z9_CHRIL|nr:unnamed protein product [Chrysodeixis includens]